jgi:hypothetical protein
LPEDAQGHLVGMSTRLHQSRVLNDTPRFAAFTVVAPGERFNAFAILVVPAFDLAIIFNVRTSSFDHARRITFFFIGSLFREPGFEHSKDV